MNKKNFFESPQCKSGKYCQVCRNKSKTSFRTTINKRYDDVSEVDFECPYGKQWEHKESPKAQEKREEIRQRMQVLADHRNKQKQQEAEKKKVSEFSRAIRNKELDALNFRYIFKNENLFQDMPGFMEEKQKIEDAVKAAEKAGKCPPCTRNKLNRSIEKFVVKNIDDVIDNLPDNLVIPLSKPLTTKQYKQSKK